MFVSVNDSLNEDINVEKKQEPPKFVTSKWETIDETELEAQGNFLQIPAL